MILAHFPIIIELRFVISTIDRFKTFKLCLLYFTKSALKIFELFIIPCTNFEILSIEINHQLRYHQLKTNFFLFFVLNSKRRF